MGHKNIRTKSTTYLTEIPEFNPGVTRTNKHVRTRKAIESQMEILNKKIRVEDFAQKRAEKQKNDRLEKRSKLKIEN